MILLIPIMYDLLSSVKPKRRYFEECFVNTMKVSSFLPSQRKPGEVDLLSSIGQKGALP